MTSLFGSGGGGGFMAAPAGSMTPEGPIAGPPDTSGVSLSGPAGVGGGFPTADALGLARIGTSAVSALSTYAMSQFQAGAMREEAGNEEIAARADYVRAAEQNNQINLAYNKVIGAQLADASAGNIDIGSGSVQEAARQASAQRNRAVTATNTTAQTDAAIRTARAQMLNTSAQVTSTSGILSGIAQLTKGLTGFAGIGAPGGD